MAFSKSIFFEFRQWCFYQLLTVVITWAFGDWNSTISTQSTLLGHHLNNAGLGLNVFGSWIQHQKIEIDFKINKNHDLLRFLWKPFFLCRIPSKRVTILSSSGPCRVKCSAARCRQSRVRIGHSDSKSDGAPFPAEKKQSPNPPARKKPLIFAKNNVFGYILSIEINQSKGARRQSTLPRDQVTKATIRNDGKISKKTFVWNLDYVLSTKTKHSFYHSCKFVLLK